MSSLVIYLKFSVCFIPGSFGVLLNVKKRDPARVGREQDCTEN